MTVSALRAQLNALHQQATARVQELATALSAQQAARAHVQAEIAVLQQRLADLDASCSQIEAQLTAPLLLPGQEFAATTTALASNATDLVPVAVFWTKRLHLHKERAALLASHPDWEAKLQDYHAFAANPAVALEAVPSSYRAAVQTTHEQMRTELAPYLQLEAQEQDLKPPRPTELQIVVAFDNTAAQIHWLLPFPATGDLAAEYAGFWDALAQILTSTVQDLANHPNWVLADITSQSWDRFTVLEAVAEFGGAEPLTAVTQNLFSTALQTAPLLEGLTLSVQVDEISLAAWQMGTGAQSTMQQASAMPSNWAEPPPSLAMGPPTADSAAIVMPGKIPAAEVEPVEEAHPATASLQRQLEELSAANGVPPMQGATKNEASAPKRIADDSSATSSARFSPASNQGGSNDGWYTEADLTSWERPLKVGGTSQWSIQARRLRTLLIRLISQGKVGMEGVPSTALWKDLPQPHDEAIRSGIEALIAKQVLRVVSGSPRSNQQVTVNPAFMGEVQNLINREPTAFWTDVLQGH